MHELITNDGVRLAHRDSGGDGAPLVLRDRSSPDPPIVLIPRSPRPFRSGSAIVTSTRTEPSQPVRSLP